MRGCLMRLRVSLASGMIELTISTLDDDFDIAGY
jgi:hypothetical protein